jgi:hypothetical protein
MVTERPMSPNDSSAKTPRPIVVAILALMAIGIAFVAGFIAGFLTPRHLLMPSQPRSEWIFDGDIPVKKSISWTDDALFRSDIPFPDVRRMMARIKFISPPSGDGLSRVIAYVADVTVAPLPKKDIPTKYLKEITETMPSGVVTTPPLEQVSYSAKFTFELLDKDGFRLSEVEEPELSIRSGETNHFQEVSKIMVPVNLANRVVQIRPTLQIVKCQSCTAA